MRALIQRVTHARVVIDGATAGAIDRGLLVLLGITHDDTPDDAKWLADLLRIEAESIGEDGDLSARGFEVLD